MPLHDRDAIRHRLEEVVFAHHTLSQEVPKYRFPHFDRHPVTVPLTHEESASFNHM